MKVKPALLVFCPFSLLFGNTTVLFQPSSASIGPFPTNALTVPASTQKTGLQVNLPLPTGCTLVSTAAQCVNVQLLNQLDGFSVNPRITVCFSGAVNPNTLSAGISFAPVGRFPLPIPINQVIYDPAGFCAYAKPNQVLDQDTQYLLVVTSAITDSGGQHVAASADYSNCVKSGGSSYCQTLSKAVNQAFGGFGAENFVAASLFTTLSATNWMQQAEANVDSGAIPGAGTLYGPMSTFNLANVTSITWMPDPGVSGVNYNETLALNVLPGVGQISFGLFLSPLYLNTSGPAAGSITVTPTNQPIPPPGLVEPVSFHVFLPSNAPRNGKIPVIIYGHGLGDDQFGASWYAASTWAQKGFATIAFEITGHGYGPLGTTQVDTASGNVTVPTPGRGVQFSMTQPIGPEDGCILPTAIGTRDCSRQSAVDLLALVRAIRTTQGLGLNLDPLRIYYTGQSFGSFYGTLFEAVEPNVLAGTLNGGGGTQIDVARLSPIARQLGAAYLATFSPSLLNVPPAPLQAYFHDSFNDEYGYRNQVVTDDIYGALAVQAGFEQADWIGMVGDPLGFAKHLWLEPLPGVPPKFILTQFGLGDLEVPNPTESALVRTAGLNLTTWMLRTDLAAGIEPQLLALMQPGVPYPIYPHRFLSNPTIFESTSPPLETAIAVAAQDQVADFFSHGWIPDPNQYFSGQFAGLKLFQIPFPLPDMLNFLQIQP